MAKLSKDLSIGTLHPRETLVASGTLGAAGAEVIVAADGAATVTLDLRGTFNIVAEVSGSVDGVNWLTIPMRPVNAATLAHLTAINAATPGAFVGRCGPYRFVRVRSTSYVSGGALATLTADPASFDEPLYGQITPFIATATAGVGAALTLTIPAAGSGLRQMISFLTVCRFAAAALTASATPVTITTTGMPGPFAMTLPADALALGTMDKWREDFPYPLACLTPNTAATLVCPATPGVIWRATVAYFVAP